MARRFVLGAILIACLFASAAQADPGGVFNLEGEALRRLHAETLEDILRTIPLVRVERQGAPGLPYRVYAAAGRAEELLLLVDGIPWWDPWSGAGLREELPMALVESVQVDLRPALAEYGAEAMAGVIRVSTRKPEEPRVETRLHFSRGSYGERGRRVAYQTPPGDVAVTVGLDEFFGDGYAFSSVWNGETPAVTATPEVTLSQRRTLSTSLHLSAGPAGPIELRLQQSRWHLSRTGEPGDKWARKRTAFELRVPESPLGSLSLTQSHLWRHSADGRASDAAITARWSRRFGTSWRLLAGAERHQINLTVDGERQAMPRPARAWLATRWDGDLGESLRGELGLRYERDFTKATFVLGETSLGVDLPWGLQLDAALGVGGGPSPWNRDRLRDLGLWPDGLGEPGAAVDASLPLRGELRFARTGERIRGSVGIVRQEGGRDWLALAQGDQGHGWLSIAGVPRHALTLGLGSSLAGEIGGLRTDFSLLADLEDPTLRMEDRSYYPLQGRGELAISRPFFGTDARLELRGSLELRGGRSDHGVLFVADGGVELRVLETRFWLCLGNALGWPGEEIPGFPVPSGTMRMGIDWQLDH